MIVHLVAARPGEGVAEAERRGWIRIGAYRFATPAKHDVRVVSRISELAVQAAQYLLIKAPDYDTGPPEGDSLGRITWLGRQGAPGQRAEFDALVASGRARWITGEDDIPVNRGVEYGAAQADGDPQKF